MTSNASSSTINEDAFEIYELDEGNGKRHTVVHVPKSLPATLVSDDDSCNSTDIFNIFMGDVSGSMHYAWPHVVKGWTDYIQDKLTGRTKIYVFSSSVSFRREGNYITIEDNIDGGTDLTSALATVRNEVDACQETNVRIFIVTDGAHNSNSQQPDTEISKMCPPIGKTVSVYLLGISSYFPVTYSIDLRSKMHNGNANIPAMFWAREPEEILDQIIDIADALNSGLVKLNMSVKGHLLPGLDKTSSVHLGEWLYFEQPPEDMPAISVGVNDNMAVPISLVHKSSNLQILLDSLFRQWNSLMIQQSRKKELVPKETFTLMDSLYKVQLEILKANFPSGHDIKTRIARKQLRTYEMEYQSLMSQSKSVIDIEGRFQDEITLAEAILKTTVTNRKYDTRNLKLKGHDQDDYKTDLENFIKVYESCKAKINDLPAPIPEDCCRVTIMSTLGDLQDPDFPLMFEETKFDLLKTFTMSGIPIYAPIKDASQINPWTLVIKHILVTPFTILSQQVLEQSAAVDQARVGSEDQDVILQQDNEMTRFNAIVPVVPPNAAETLKPIVLSNVYAMMCTFCILKNPHIIDYSVHLAGLACAWIRTVREYPITNRPEFATDRLASIIATANLYMGRPSIIHYVNALANNPKQALMTESTEEFDGKVLKCESLVKPIFFMYLQRDKFLLEQKTSVLELVLYEFVGRCISSYKTGDAEASPYTYFFCSQLTDKEERKTWLAKHCKTITDKVQGTQGNLLETFYTTDDLVRETRKIVAKEVSQLTEKISKEITVATDMNRVMRLRNFASCGDVMWMSLKTWAQEMSIPQEKIEELTSPEKIMTYIVGSLQNKNSKERLAKDIPSGDLESVIIKAVLYENMSSLRAVICSEVEEYAVKQWRDAYMVAHRPLVMPMTLQEVVVAANAKGIQVTEDSFKKMYRYTESVGLLRNACQIPGCPYYLEPHNNFNQHISVEREEEGFPHALHLVSQEFCDKGFDDVVGEVMSGKHAGTNKRKVPPAPAQTSLDLLTDQLKSLITHYSQISQSLNDDTVPLKTNDEEDDRFFDCEP